MTRKLLAYLIAVMATYVVGVLFVGQFNISQIVDMGFPVSISQRFETLFYDLIGMLQLYLPMVAIALLIALMFTGLLLMRFLKAPQLLYPLAGFVAMIVLHLSLKAAFGMNPVAPTRELAGLLTQGLAGALGGWAYLRFSVTKPENTAA